MCTVHPFAARQDLTGCACSGGAHIGTAACYAGRAGLGWTSPFDGSAVGAGTRTSGNSPSSPFSATDYRTAPFSSLATLL